MGLDSKEIMTFTKAVANLPEQELDRLQRMSEYRNKNEKIRKNVKGKPP